MNLGWIDFSPTHRKRLESIMDLFQEKRVLDELGIGTVRDAFANTLFPGTTTIQTRARSVLLPVLLLPLILPLVLSAASGVASFMVDTPPELAEVTSNFAIVAAYDLLMLTVGVLTYNYVVEG